jgi:hypothetical protein
MGAPVTKRLERAEAVAPMHDLVENEADTRPGLSPPDLVAADPVDRRTEPRGCDHSMIRTLRERWNLGPHLTRRDATAPDIAPVLTRSTPRPQEDWPDVTPQPVPQPTDALVAVDRPLPRWAGTCSASTSRSTSTTRATDPTSTPAPPPANRPTAT